MAEEMGELNVVYFDPRPEAGKERCKRSVEEYQIRTKNAIVLNPEKIKDLQKVIVHIESMIDELKKIYAYLLVNIHGAITVDALGEDVEQEVRLQKTRALNLAHESVFQFSYLTNNTGGFMRDLKNEKGETLEMFVARQQQMFTEILEKIKDKTFFI